MSQFKNLICYTTGRPKTTKIIQQFARGVVNRGVQDWVPRVINIEDFLNNGHPADTDAIVCLGILRGTGLALQSAASKGIDRYYIDHAYFNPGYDGNGWLRISKNKHTMNYLPETEVYSDRWKANFSTTNDLYAWRPRRTRGDKILVLPPTHAVQWYFNSYNWEDMVVDKLKQNLPASMHNLIKVRKKPNEPIVDKLGNLLRLEKQVSEENVPLQQDLDDANIVIAYNSMVALQATMQGIPVITNQHNCCYPISYTFEDLFTDVNNPKFDQDPNRKKLVHWLSSCQFNNAEIQRGTAWDMMNALQGQVG